MLTRNLDLVDEETLYEHVYELFVSRGGPSQSELGLGYISRTNTVELTVANRDLEIKQSLSMLNSSTESSTTGAVAWKVSPLLAEWFLSPKSAFNELVIDASKTIVELGTGVAGIIASTIGTKVNRYIATDQEHILKLLDQNISTNVEKGLPKSKKKLSPSPDVIRVCEYDWEHLETVGNFWSDIEDIKSDGIIMACDTVYNDYLIPHLVNAVTTVARAMGPGAHIILAQQLRTHEILELCLAQFLSAGFSIWSVPDELLSNDLTNGFVIHYLQLT